VRLEKLVKVISEIFSTPIKSIVCLIPVALKISKFYNFFGPSKVLVIFASTFGILSLKMFLN